MSRLELLEEAILPTAVLAGAFGEDVELINCDTHEDSHGQDQYASIVMFSSIDIKRKNKTETVRIVVKFNQENEIYRKSVLTDFQLQNEVFMYEQFIPFLRIDKIITPVFFYGVATGGRSPEQDVIILQDLCKDNYHIKKGGLDLDYDHVLIALKQLAKMHAASFVAKYKQEDTFYKNVDHLNEAQWRSEKRNEINASLGPVVRKVAEVLKLKRRRSVHILENFLEHMKNPFDYVKELLIPLEPISVICHGDFCKENILFKYNENGSPVEAKFVDFGTVRYASPFVDLSYFLFYNTTSNLRREYMDDLLTEYYEVLKSSSEGIDIPQIEAFENEFQNRAVYGFLDCCLQIPIALSGGTDWEELSMLTKDNLEKYYEQSCNLEATTLLCDILKDLIYFKCKL